MRIQVHGDYKSDDMAVLGQHIAVQLEALGIAGVSNVWLSVRPLDAKGRKLDVMADNQPVETVELSVSDLDRPAVQSAKLTVRPSQDRAASPARSRGRSAPRRRHTKTSG